MYKLYPGFRGWVGNSNLASASESLSQVKAVFLCLALGWPIASASDQCRAERPWFETKLYPLLFDHFILNEFAPLVLRTGHSGKVEIIRTSQLSIYPQVNQGNEISTKKIPVHEIEIYK